MKDVSTDFLTYLSKYKNLPILRLSYIKFFYYIIKNNEILFKQFINSTYIYIVEMLHN